MQTPKFPLRRSHLSSFILVFALVFGFGATAKAQDILHTAGTHFFEAEDRFKRVGIEMEMSGLSFEELERILRKHFKILRVKKISELETHLFISEGPIKLKIEGQAWRYEENPEKYAAQIAEDIKTAPREIVF